MSSIRHCKFQCPEAIMKTLISILALVACSQAGYLGYPYLTHPYTVAPTYGAFPYAAHYAAYPLATKTQYHSQDIFGQASYGYAHAGQAHSAIRDAAGNVRGSYAYINPEGKEVRVNYVADSQGFRAESNALPEAPVAPVANLVAPEPVQDTPEVVEARKAHLDAVEKTKSRQRRLVA